MTPVGIEHGPWRAVLSLGEVGHLTHDGVEVLRAVRVVARDRDWNTLPHVAGPHETTRDGDALVVTYPITIRTDDGGVAAEAVVHVRLDDRCTVTATITATRDLEVNRLGLVVLHSPTLAGSPLTVEHPDGSTTRTAFPVRIAPHQPAVDIVGLRHRVGDRAVALRFSGDVFETEDQRNWTDASYKTYSRPLALPFPYALSSGEVVWQSVAVEVRPAPAPVSVLEARAAPVTPVAADAFTVGTASGRHVDGPLPPAAPGAGPLLVELTADHGSWRAIVARARREAEALGVPVDLRVVARDAADLGAALRAAGTLPLARVGVFDPVTHVTERAGWDALRRWRDDLVDAVPLVAGSRAHFTELNRTAARLPRDADLVAFSITPMMHATDPEHVEESLGMQRLVAEDAVVLADGIPVVVGPVTFRRRFNAVATAPSPGSETEARRGDDPVIASAYAASWFTRSLEALRVPGVVGGVWFEATGPRGLVAPDGTTTPAGSAWYAAVSRTVQDGADHGGLPTAAVPSREERGDD